MTKARGVTFFLLHWLARVTSGLERIAGFATLAVIILLVLGIVMRYIFNAPIAITYDAGKILMVVVLYLVIGSLLLQGGHVRVDFIVLRLPQKAQALVDLVISGVALALFALITWQVWGIAWGALKAHDYILSGTTRIPFFPVVLLVPIGSFVLCACLIARMSGYLRILLSENRGSDIRG